MGFYPSSISGKLGGGHGDLQHHTRAGKAVLVRGWGEEAHRSGLLESGVRVCSSAVCRLSGNVLQPVGAPGLVQKVLVSAGLGGQL